MGLVYSNTVRWSSSRWRWYGDCRGSTGCWSFGFHGRRHRSRIRRILGDVSSGCSQWGRSGCGDCGGHSTISWGGRSVRCRHCSGGCGWSRRRCSWLRPSLELPLLLALTQRGHGPFACERPWTIATTIMKIMKMQSRAVKQRTLKACKM
ncbi:hypothetical protein ANANG_G00004970, partial [Anguilla anguilla]